MLSNGWMLDYFPLRNVRGSNLPANPVLVVHGGAWAIPDDMVEAHLTGVRNALAAAWQILRRGGSALDSVEEAVSVMEDDETFDAGRGSFLPSTLCDDFFQGNPITRAAPGSNDYFRIHA